jgi:hypothetical protein
MGLARQQHIDCALAFFVGAAGYNAPRSATDDFAYPDNVGVAKSAGKPEVTESSESPALGLESFTNIYFSCSSRAEVESADT